MPLRVTAEAHSDIISSSRPRAESDLWHRAGVLGGTEDFSQVMTD